MSSNEKDINHLVKIRQLMYPLKIEITVGNVSLEVYLGGWDDFFSPELHVATQYFSH